ncbi:hypothetical protein LTR10_016813 [Elasticomyces elasticus]|uniref:Zn(2)-C6 fungal-type domain-containing protein n=1 Tax=Exophiala sideris TaxID=1016849 RepID=A0ABR0JN05_9EURO|nr:hypothetical protein LTR10_016813 [Elasticomyces elasticus]KAK5037816.1 hypothetical protein LTS07_001283 [Exophiala sideris]KAK5043799.1 hypothetical protein LTR13_000153 [Exophiala sideris]KAK5067298.1 hypothetical protein LTR69_001285 [Exophiala sideris]KAK5182631.1 hypothetical protein LTR44_005022 [Eurotiomycetes sp. CCFEE 6388]
MPKERQTCTECSMRRQKCDRNLPCGRCVKRGDADKCTRAWPNGGYDPKVHRIYPRTSGDTSASSPTITDTSPAATVHNASEPSTHPSMRTPASAQSRPSPQMQPSSYPGNLGPAPTNGPVTDVDNAATTLEFLTWGRSKLSDYDLKALELLKEPHHAGPALVPKDSGPDWDATSGFGGTGAAQISFLQLLLPSRGQVYQLVEYHASTIVWYHGCFHGPTFIDELNEVYKAPGGLQIRDMDLRWAALLFSIMAASTTCASEQLASSWGFKKHERAKLTRQWYKATVTCLNLADYMWRHHIYSVQAIGVLTMSAHVLGFSNTQSTLLGAALKIAQGLGLQRLGPEDETASTIGASLMLTAAQRDKVIKRETGRRVWAQLCIQDWFSIPFSEMYSIQKSHFTSLRPSHIDDTTLQPLPVDFPANTDFPNVLLDIAGLMPQIHDAIISSNTLYTKYEQVLHYDDKMRTLASDGLPRFFSMREPISPEWPAFVPWARRSSTICFAHKIIMIHRAFLGRSFTEQAFDFTRRTCMAAAKTILKEARQAYDEEGPMLWIDQAFMVAAGITLALDIFHRKPHEPEYEEHRKLVDNTISMLGKFEGSMIALRGIRLLSSLLAEQARLTADQTLEKYRKRTHDAMNDHSQPKKQKFNIPKFVENFVGNDSFTHSLRNANKGIEPSMDLFEPEARTPVRTPAPQDPVFTSDFGYETFEQLFPPHTGISNNFLFEDLLNFDI